MTTLAPELRFKEFSGEWSQGTLGELFEMSSGGTPSRQIRKYWSGEIPWVTTAEVANHSLITQTLESISIEGLNNSSAKLFPVNTVLVALYGQGKTRGKVAMLGIAATTNQACLGIFPNEDVDPCFIYHYLDKNYDNMRSMANGGSQENLSMSILKKFKISYPSIAEQRKIAAFFSVLDQKILKQREKVEELEQVKIGIIKKLFTQKIRFMAEGGMDFPDWEKSSVGDYFDERSERDFDDLELLSVSVKEGVIRRSDLDEKDNSSDDKSNYKRVQPDDLVYNSMRMWQGASGVSKYAGIVSPAYTVLKPKRELSSKYFGYLFKTPEMIYQFKKFSQGLTSDTWNLKYPQIKDITIEVPSLLEQNRIVRFLSLIDEKITLEKKKAEYLVEMKTGLLRKMIV